MRASALSGRRLPDRTGPGCSLAGGGPRALTSAAALLLTLAGLALAFLLLRLAVLAGVLSDAEIGLHVDEAQYLHWSQALHWGYFSKPPVVVALIAASTALLGDGLVGVKLLVMACHPLAAAVTGALAHAMCLAALADSRPGDAVATPADTALARRVAVAAALLVASSPLSSLLGLVATTDGPLMLCWALGAAAGWRFVRHGRRADALWLGLALGLGLLSKYTALALLPSLCGLVFAARPALPCGTDFAPRGPAQGPDQVQVRGRLAGLGLAAGVALLLLLPHLLWNAQHGWPTLRHTLDITAQAGRGAAGSAGRSATEFVAGQVLMFGPLWALALAVGLWRRARGGMAGGSINGPVDGSISGPINAAWRRQRLQALWLALPLLAVGLLQALAARAQVNWTAPAAIGLALAAALGWGQRAAGATGRPPAAAVVPGWARAVMAVHLLAGIGVVLAPPLATALGHALPRQLDIWSRMRGWESAYAALRPAVAAHLAAYPQAQVIALERTSLVQAAHAWRSLPPIHWLAWREPSRGGPRHHYELVTRWAEADSPPARAPVLILAAGRDATALPAALRARLGPLQALARSTRLQGGTAVPYTLWRAERRDALPAEPLAAPQPDLPR